MTKLIVVITALSILGLFGTAYIITKAAQFAEQLICEDAQITVNISEGRYTLTIEQEKAYQKALKTLERCE